jgi:hypothetical protein
VYSVPSSVDCVTDTTPGCTLDPAERLGRAALVHVQMGALGADHALPGPQHRPQADDVGARAVEHREGDGVRAEVRLDRGLQARRPLVGAVGDGVALVGGGDRLQGLGQYGGVVVAGEGTHGARR